MHDLHEIRRKKLEELKQIQNEQAKQIQQQQQVQQKLNQLELIVKQVFTKKALLRYGNIKAAFPEKASQLLIILGDAVQSGQVKRIDDKTLKELLNRIAPKKKKFNIKRI